MRKYLEKPIVIQWNMKNNIYNNIIVKKVCELTPIKLRFIDPHSIEDFRIIDEIIEYSSIQHYQIEYDIADLNIEEISYLEHQKLNFYIKFDIFEFDEIMRKKLVEILNKCEKAQILIYITHKNIRETIELVKWLYNENKANIFYICPKKKVKNSLINTRLYNKTFNVSFFIPSISIFSPVSNFLRISYSDLSIGIIVSNFSFIKKKESPCLNSLNIPVKCSFTHLHLHTNI